MITPRLYKRKTESINIAPDTGLGDVSAVRIENSSNRQIETNFGSGSCSNDILQQSV